MTPNRRLEERASRLTELDHLSEMARGAVSERAQPDSVDQEGVDRFLNCIRVGGHADQALG